MLRTLRFSGYFYEHAFLQSPVIVFVPSLWSPACVSDLLWLLSVKLNRQQSPHLDFPMFRRCLSSAKLFYNSFSNYSTKPLEFSIKSWFTTALNLKDWFLLSTYVFDCTEDFQASLAVWLGRMKSWACDMSERMFRCYLQGHDWWRNLSLTVCCWVGSCGGRSWNNVKCTFQWTKQSTE